MEFAGMPSSILYRSSLVRSRDPFFPGSGPSADAAACLKCLQQTDLGFVHQILSFERIHDQAITNRVRELDSYLLDRLDLLFEYGPIFLTHSELEYRIEEVSCEYYRALATGVINGKNREYWNYHYRRLEEIGYSLYGVRLGKALCGKILDLLFNPKQTIEKVLARLNGN
jgi:hypothetical protein